MNSFLILPRTLAISFLLVMSACSTVDTDTSALVYSAPDYIASPAKRPWINEHFNNGDGKFTFAVVSDLNGGEREGVFTVAAEQISLLKPDFVLTVGDLIDGNTEDPAELNRQWDSFDERAKKAGAPLFHLPGNHDLTNLSMRKVWSDRYGPRYYHFIYKDTLFLILDSEDFEPERMQYIYKIRAEALAMLKTDPEKAKGLEYMSLMEARVGEIGVEQSAYFEKIIADNPKVRHTFVLMHKPVWMREDERNLDRIEAALAGRAYTVLNGHFHRYSHTVKNGADHIILGTTGGSRGYDNSSFSMDHIMFVTMTDDGPSIANLKLEGIRDKAGAIPAGGEELCFWLKKCPDPMQ